MGLTTKIEHHITINQSRNLSVKGRAIVTNSLLLSRIWHVARVTIIPARWIQDINKLVTSFVFSFYPRPSLNFACRPRKEGGLGLINVHDQILALHNIYLDRLLSNKHPNPLTGVINVLVRLYTGYNSILPFLMAPQVYARSLAAIPHLAHLSKLLQRLPPIDISEHWTPRMTRYIPLVRATQPAHPTSTPIAYDRKAVIQDLVPYSFLHGRYEDIYTLTPRKNRSLWTALVQGDYEWNPNISEQFDPVYTPKDREGPPWFTVKELGHWTIKHTSLQRIRGIPQHTSVSVYMAKPRFLRQCWIQANPKKYMLPSTRIPMSPAPAIMMSNSQWKLFWRLPLPHK
ncbi:hypothetical protein, partial, partial [Absidia glauca]